MHTDDLMYALSVVCVYVYFFMLIYITYIHILYSIILYYMQYIMYIHVPDGFHSLRYMVLITAACSQRVTFHAVQVPDLVRGSSYYHPLYYKTLLGIDVASCNPICLVGCGFPSSVSAVVYPVIMQSFAVIR